MRAKLGIASVLALVAALASLQTASASNSWHQLHRPLDLPRVGPDEECPVSPVDDRIDWQSANIFGGAGTGRGPVYPGLGESGHLRTASEGSSSSWFGGKVFWYVTPKYRERVLIRGRRLDGPESMRFSDDGRRSRQLRIRRKSDISWEGQPPGSRGEPSGVLVRASGCYGVQIDGTNFSRTVVFTASTP